MMIGPHDLTVVPHKRYPCGGDDVVVAMTIVNNMSGLKIYTEMIATYEVNEARKITELRVCRDVEAVAAQLQ